MRLSMVCHLGFKMLIRAPFCGYFRDKNGGKWKLFISLGIKQRKSRFSSWETSKIWGYKKGKLKIV